MKTYLCVYLSSFFLALVITPVVIRLARRLGVADIPGARHVHVKPVPHIGGIAIFFSVMCHVVIVLFLSNAVGEAFRDVLYEIIALLLAGGFMFFVGLVDDIKPKGLRARAKFLAQLAAAIIVCAAGIRIESVSIADLFTLRFGAFSWPLTFLWIIGITNAVNLSDGLDGLAAGISAVACGVITIFAILSGQVIMVVLMIAMLGGLTGFLFFNFNPAKIFMGDCGSMFLGFTLASSSALCAAKSSTLIGLALPVLALGIPIFDTLFSMLRRFVERRSMFAPDKRHFHHRLLDLGLRQRHAVIAIYVITLLVAALGVFVMVMRDSSSLVVFFCILLLIILVFRVVGSVRLRETIKGLQRRHAITHQMQEEKNSFQDAVLYFDRATTPEQWWQAVCRGAQYMDFVWLSIGFTDDDGRVHTSIWRRGDSKLDMANVAIVTIPINGRNAAKPMELEMAIAVDSSLESVGRRAALFSRLIEEHDPVHLLGDRKMLEYSTRNAITDIQTWKYKV
jgi:UDP-GlcNAc:undecaprenyl-phosphate GlcNAc-1-phosphate transferase